MPNVDPARSLVVVVDDQASIRLAVSTALTREGFRVAAVADAKSALAAIARDRPALAIVDIGLEGMDGLALLREVRRTSELPIILLSGRTGEVDRVVGLELGADDYLTKPFSPREMVARVRTVLRRTARQHWHTAAPRAPVAQALVPDRSRVIVGGLVVDADSREVVLDGRTVEITRREFDLLLVLASTPRRVYSRDQLLRLVWGSSAEWQAPSTVTEHVRRLRLKLETQPAHPRLIQTVRGIGYRLVPPAGAPADPPGEPTEPPAGG